MIYILFRSRSFVKKKHNIYHQSSIKLFHFPIHFILIFPSCFQKNATMSWCFQKNITTYLSIDVCFMYTMSVFLSKKKHRKFFLLLHINFLRRHKMYVKRVPPEQWNVSREFLSPTRNQHFLPVKHLKNEKKGWKLKRGIFLMSVFFLSFSCSLSLTHSVCEWEKWKAIFSVKCMAYS
jgi:Ca2+/H+ antiporter